MKQLKQEVLIEEFWLLGKVLIRELGQAGSSDSSLAQCRKKNHQEARRWVEPGLEKRAPVRGNKMCIRGNTL